MAQQRVIRSGEMLALDASAIHRGADGFFFLIGDSTPENRRHAAYSSVSIVSVRGSLEHHKTSGADNYESILERVQEAMGGDDMGIPGAVVLSVDSRGGVVSGLNECVTSLRKLRKQSGVPLIAFVNEMAASAAYAICCACDAIYAPRSAILGSIGTISQMISLQKQDEMQGIEVVLLTSGDRKADGHIHGTITTKALDAEQGRVDELANNFFELVSEVRKLKVPTIEAMQAAIYLAPQAEMRDLCDDILSLDELAEKLSKEYPAVASSVPTGKGNETDRKARKAAGFANTAAQSGTIPDTSAASQVDTRGTDESVCAREPELKPEPTMMALASLIEKTEAALAAATDPKKKARLERDLATYRFTMMRAEGGEGGDDDDEDDDEDSKAAQAHKMAERKAKKAEAAKHRANAAKHRAKAAEYEDAAKKCESEDDDDEEEVEDASHAGGASAEISPAAAAAIAEQARVAEEALKEVRELKAKDAKREQMAMIETALAGAHITPAEAKMLRGKAPAWCKEYIETRGEVRVVNTDEGELIKPRESTPQPSAERAQVEAQVRQMGLKEGTPEFTKLVDETLANRAKVAANGLGAIGWRPSPSEGGEVGRY